MRYLIYASLDNGKPTLKVVDAVTRKTCLNWHCRVQQGLATARATAAPPPPCFAAPATPRPTAAS